MQPLDISKYPDSEARTPREAFTAKLRKICAKLDAGASQVFTYKSWITDEDVSATFEACSLWVFGSYARGALTCGDLDLVLHIGGSAPVRPRHAALTKAFVGTHAQVRVYHGTPEENGSGVALTDAVLVWQPGMDWAAALDNIQADPQASRFARPGDALPFRSEQDGLSCGRREDLAELCDKGIFRWRFVPLSSISQELNPDETRGRGPSEAWVLQCYGEQSAMKQKLLPVVLGFARELAAQHCPGARIEWSEGREIRVGGVQVQVGTLHLNLHALSDYSKTAIAFIPALNTRGPNGFWLIERGPNHPTVKAFAGVQAWVLAGSDGDLCLTTGIARPGAGAHEMEAQLLEVYATQQEAQEWADQLYEDDDSPERDAYRCYPRLLEGQELLQAMVQVDALMPMGDDIVPLTYWGERFCAAEGSGTSLPDAKALAAKLRALLSVNTGPAASWTFEPLACAA